MYSELLSATRPTRQLAPADPSTFVEGGGTTQARGTLRDTDPRRQDLEEWFNVWAAGGPVGALLDKRALMIFGVGSEWVSDDDAVTAPHPRTGEPVTADEYLEFVWPQRRRDEWFIRTAQTCYWAGFSVWEPIPTTEGGLVPNREPWHGFEYVHPPTIDAFWDDTGEIQSWVQRIRSPRHVQGRLETELDVEDILHVTLNPKGRHPMGLSIVDRSWEEIQTFRQNKHSTAEALQRFAYLGGQVKVGREDGPAIDDNELRRVRQRYRRAEGAKWLVTGHDIDMLPFDSGTIGDGINAIRDRDIQDLATTLDVPLEWTNYAGDGLGTGQPAESRLQSFESSGQSEQSRMAMHAVEWAKRLLAESPFPDEVHIDLRFDDILADQKAVAEAYRDYKTAYTINEIREKFGDGPVPDEADIDGDAPVQEEDAGGAGAGGGLFDLSAGGPDSDFLSRALQEVPDNAVSISDPSEAPEGASIIRGPRGGLYYVPGGGDEGAEGDLGASPEFSEDPPDSVDISGAAEGTNLTEAGVPDGDTKSDIEIVDTAGGQVFVKEQGIMDFVREQGFEGTVNDPLASTQMGSAVVRAVGGGTTTNWVDSENDIIRSEGVDNVAGAASSADTGFDEESLTDTIAAGLLAGNEDMHAAQFVADDDGQAYLIDHDHSARSLENDRVIRKLQAVSGPLATQDIEFEDVWNRAKEQVEAADIEGMAAGLEAQGLDDHADALRQNAAYITENDASEVA